ncbi:hypothetical protein EV182_002375 [Spiromyces aspiralis]|uniref:Uncharacterized protein n=1 Tax=Spiromyces aspiralis TaxID=68401 RepID=A0ACC1HGW9_9FUNG|nr:hypothetical protein EV182_002375 [Spiromyces aspiralis]
MTSVGTLLAFALSHLGVIILRWTRPEVHRGFRVPLGPWVFPPIGIIISILLLVLSGKQTIARLFIWLGIGLVVYALFGYHRSRINNPHKWADLSQPEYDGVVKPDDVESNSKEVHHVYTEDSKIPSPPFDGYNDAAIADSHSISSSKQQVFANREPSPTARH